ncbi:integrase core domain-containing protein [Streptomyces sp. SGAir0957]
MLTAVRTQRVNSIMERRVRSLRRELLDRSLLWNVAHLGRALREYEQHYDHHRTHRTLQAAAPLRIVPQPLNSPQIEHLPVWTRLGARTGPTAIRSGRKAASQVPSHSRRAGRQHAESLLVALSTSPHRTATAPENRHTTHPKSELRSKLRTPP